MSERWHDGGPSGPSGASFDGVPFFESVATYDAEMGGRLDMAFKYIEHGDPVYPQRIDDSIEFIAKAFEAMAYDVAYEASPDAVYYFPAEVDVADERRFVQVGDSYELAAGFVDKYDDQLSSDDLHKNSSQPEVLATLYGSCGSILHMSADRFYGATGNPDQSRQTLERAGMFYHRAIGQLMNSRVDGTAKKFEHYKQRALQINELLGGQSADRNARFLSRIALRHDRS
jgi:hypothetical protein